MPVITIVALPEADELVWDLSSEKKPHMTLLMINDPEGTEEVNILEFVQHAANTSLSRFGLSVDRRGTLGPKDADVLFFDTEFGVPELRKFRAQLLQNDHIYKNYVKEDQFPGWIPHLTMGYPEAPAKEVPDGKEYGLKWINFDRIAVWIDDFEGPEFELRKHNMAQLDDAYWSEPKGVYIMQYGKKGMHWGVRKDVASVADLRTGSGGLMVAPGGAAPSKSDAKQGGKAMGHVRAQLMRSEDSPFAPGGTLEKHNKNYEGKFPLSAQATKKYDGEVGKMLTDYVKTKVPEGADAHVEIRGDDALIVIGSPEVVTQFKTEVLNHAEGEESAVYTMPLVRDENGLIVGIKDIPSSTVADLLKKVKHGGLDSADSFLAHDILGMTDEEYIAHYGRLGMRWGVRHPVGSDGRVVTPPKSGSAEEALAKVKRGGKASADHQALVKNLDKKVDQLSTEEIRQITKRIKAVQEFNAVTKAQKEAKRGILSKTLRWAVGSAHKGAEEFGEQWIKGFVKKNLKGVVPEPPDLSKKKDKTPPPQQTKPTPVDSFIDNSPKPSKQLALEDLATVLARIDKEED